MVRPLSSAAASSTIQMQCIFKGFEKMNRLASLLFCACVAGGALTANAADVSGNVTMATDYRFRGISQLTGQFSPAIQGGFDFATDMGFYVGTWASNVNFSGGAIETDFTASFKGTIGDGLGYDIGVLYYGYPKDYSADLGYTEVYTSATFKGAKIRRQLLRQLLRWHRQVLLPVHRIRIDVMKNLSLSLHYGYNSFDTDKFLGNSDHYSDWKVGLSSRARPSRWTSRAGCSAPFQVSSSRCGQTGRRPRARLPERRTRVRVHRSRR